MRFVHVEVHREELHGGDPQRDQVLDHGRVRQSGVRALEVLRDVGVQLGLPADVRFVDDGVAPRNPGTAVGTPVEVALHPDARDEILALVHRPAVGVQQQRLHAAGVEIRGGHGQREGLVVRRRPEAVPRTGRHAFDDAVVHAVGHVRQGFQLPDTPGRLVGDFQGGHAGRVDSHIREGTPRIVRCRRTGDRNADSQRKRPRGVYGGSCVYVGHNHCLKFSRAEQIAPDSVFLTKCSVRNSGVAYWNKRRKWR